jgi:NitT/TauT family transport system permease protein
MTSNATALPSLLPPDQGEASIEGNLSSRRALDRGASGWRTRAMSLLVGCLLWEAVARLASTPVLPPCTATVQALIELTRRGLIFANLASSLVNLLAGFGAAAVIGIAVGVAMARIRPVRFVLEPYLFALLAAPGMIYLPLLFTFFGSTRFMQVASVFVHAIFVVTATTADALRPGKENLIVMAAAFGASENQIFWRIRWPAARPRILSGLRISALLAVKGMINGEMFIAWTGLGALVRTYGTRFEADKVLAIVAVIAAVALACGALIDGIERRTARRAA